MNRSIILRWTAFLHQKALYKYQYSGPCYRGMNLSKEDFEKNYKVGTKFLIKPFTSTSKNRKITEFLPMHIRRAILPCSPLFVFIPYLILFLGFHAENFFDPQTLPWIYLPYPNFRTKKKCSFYPILPLKSKKLNFRLRILSKFSWLSNYKS
jgi:hypothetical protein